jgi:hypothetical protein
MAPQTQPLTPTQARELAQEFHDIAAAIGTFRLAQVNSLTDAQQLQLQNLQLQCIQFSNTFITLGLFAAQANLASTLQTIKQQTDTAKQAISTINTIDRVLQIATAAAVLGASIASMNPSAVASGMQGLISAVTGSSSTTGSSPATSTTSSTTTSGGGAH